MRYRLVRTAWNRLFYGDFANAGLCFHHIDAVQLAVLVGYVHAADGIDAHALGTVDAAVVGVDVGHGNRLQSGSATTFAFDHRTTRIVASGLFSSNITTAVNFEGNT